MCGQLAERYGVSDIAKYKEKCRYEIDKIEALTKNQESSKVITQEVEMVEAPVELPRGDVRAMYERGRSMVESKKCKRYWLNWLNRELAKCDE